MFSCQHLVTGLVSGDWTGVSGDHSLTTGAVTRVMQYVLIKSVVVIISYFHTNNKLGQEGRGVSVDKGNMKHC